MFAHVAQINWYEYDDDPIISQETSVNNKLEGVYKWGYIEWFPVLQSYNNRCYHFAVHTNQYPMLTLLTSE